MNTESMLEMSLLELGYGVDGSLLRHGGHQNVQTGNNEPATRSVTCGECNETTIYNTGVSDRAIIGITWVGVKRDLSYLKGSTSHISL
jgi:hypothetical protein